MKVAQSKRSLHPSGFLFHPSIHCTLMPATRSPFWLESVE